MCNKNVRTDAFFWLHTAINIVQFIHICMVKREENSRILYLCVTASTINYRPKVPIKSRFVNVKIGSQPKMFSIIKLNCVNICKSNKSRL